MNDDIRLHSALIGRPSGREQLNTPALVIDRGALDRNIAKMAGYAAACNVALRPHAKTHKSVDIAKRQIAAGAVGVCCAKLGEAEALAEGGITNILITSPVATPQAIRRLIDLNARIASCSVVVDHPDNVSAIAAAADRPLKVFLDVDPGARRTGVASPDAALDLARRIGDLPKLVYAGVQMYCGSQQHIASYAEREAAIRERTRYLESILALLSQHGYSPPCVTGCGTGTHRIDAALGVFTEWQAGSYIFMDRQYTDCDLKGDGTVPFEYSLFVDAHVISANTRGMATIDAGLKALATDAGPPVIVSGAPTRRDVSLHGR